MDAGSQHGNQLYWIFGSVTGATPGITLAGMHFPLNPDLWTDITIAGEVAWRPRDRVSGRTGAGSSSARFAGRMPSNLISACLF